MDLRGLTKVVRGMGVLTKGIDSRGEVVELWIHEVERVWRDRLGLKEERDKLDGIVNEVVTEVLRIEVTK